MTPLFIRWEDGRLIYINKVLAVERAPARIPPLLPVRYTCTIMGKKRWLYFEPDIMRWFVEVQE